MISTEVGRSSPPTTVVRLPSPLTRMSAPVFGSAGVPSNGPSQKPCERAKSVRPRPNSTSTASLTPEATSVAVVDPGSNVTTLPFCGRGGWVRPG